eukprot:TRINITY_DN1084_c6_g1_i2.p1 TRINITY_DN1084_c6_g1~~TRINITY_DN1084_c6_g1_i2.p1  ORF type:complete len:355 (+),score=48.09 TRINITY_DN1084_c6_g1_i2:231-1295(+)
MAKIPKDLTETLRNGDICNVVEEMLQATFAKEIPPSDPIGEMASYLQGMKISTLNEKFGVEGKIKFVTGNGGLTKIVLQHDDETSDGNKVEVYLHGAHVSRWSINGFDVLWMSNDSHFAQGKAIRGGIPICWPQFGPGDLPQHGFLRNSSSWEVIDTEANKNNVSISLAHTSNQDTLEVWPHSFRVVYTVHLKLHTLTTSISVENTGEDTFSFTGALHTYFNLPHVKSVQVGGLEGLTYLDNLKGRKETAETDEPYRTIDKETDRIYLSTPSQLSIEDGHGAVYTINKSPSFPDAVLWNPWVKKSRAMQDFNNYGWRHMVCLETAAIKEPVSVSPNATWYGSQTLSVELPKQSE